MTAKELTEKTIKDIALRRKKRDVEFYAYQKEHTTKKKRGWNVKLGGFRW
jgi:hypothetical protein